MHFTKMHGLGNDYYLLIVLANEPAYPEYEDTNFLCGRRIIHLEYGEKNGFLPLPSDEIQADIIYICSPNNPHSTFEILGGDTCAIEMCSLSKTTGFTGTRLGYTVVPKALKRMGMNLNTMWARNRETRTDGICYILQKDAAAVFTPTCLGQIQENVQVYKENARELMDAFDRKGIWHCGGKNSPYIWLKCPEDIGGWECFDYLLNVIWVVGIPDDGFGTCGKGYFRFPAFGDSEKTNEAAKQLCKLLRR